MNDSIPLSPMRYVVRADASMVIGSGHVMRTSAIAEELIARGSEVVFVGRILDLPWVVDRIVDLGFARIIDEPEEFVPSGDSEILILDSYEISTIEDFIGAHDWTKVVGIVDELTPKYSCDLRIHPGLDGAWTGYSNSPILAGPNFIPLRKSLAQNKFRSNSNSSLLKVAVVAGGSDTFKMTIELAEILASFTDEFTVLLFTNHRSKVNNDHRFQFMEIGQRLDELTREADLILTTSSTSSLEFIARGFCVGVACAVDNQRQYYESLGRLGVAAQIGFRNSSNEWEFDERIIHSLVTSPSLRESLRFNSVGLIDFFGAGRIVDAIQFL